MGFWNDVWRTIKQVGTLGYDVFKPVVMTLKDVVAGEASGGPLGAAMAGLTSGIKNISTGVSRFKADWEDITQNNGTGSGLSDDISGIKSSISSSAGMGMLTDSLKNVSAGAPDSVKQMAVAAAKFHDGLDKHGNIDAAVRSAGGTPITSHLSRAMSNTVTDHVKSVTGFDAYNAARRHPVFGQASMLPSTSMFHGDLMDSLQSSTPERMAVQYVTNLRQNASANPGVVSGSG